MLRPGQQLSVVLGLKADSAVAPKLRMFLNSTNGWSSPVLTKARPMDGGQIHLTGQVPPRLPRGVYHLEVKTSSQTIKEPNAVRILGQRRTGSFRFSVITDHQFLDPSYTEGVETNTGRYPRIKFGEPNIAITLQGFDELALWDPDFVLHTGDLVFGLDYSREYPAALKLLNNSRLPIFAVPGNHDAYAIYKVNVRPPVLSRLVKCAKEIWALLGKLDYGNLKSASTAALSALKNLDGSLLMTHLGAMAVESWKFSRKSWPRVWHTMFLVAKCLWTNVRSMFYGTLHQDGLKFWRNNIGPTEYTFDRGRFRFIGVNTYQGSQTRRHSFTIQIAVDGKPIGVPFADNYGGYLPEKRLASLESEVKKAVDQGKVPVLFGHHSPFAEAQTVNVEYPAGDYRFQEWNYYGKGCLRKNEPLCKKETATNHSGIRLLEILATHGGYYLCGHSHVDDWKVHSGTVRGVTVTKPFTIIRTTTAASSGKWGYRILEARGSEIEPVGSSKGDRSSIPTGNLWQVTRAGGVDLHTSLPRIARLTVPMEVPTTTEGYTFKWKDAKRSPPAARVVDLWQREGSTRYQVLVELPASKQNDASRYRLVAQKATGNRAPNAQISHPGISETPGGTITIQAGASARLSAASSVDPDGQELVKHLWLLDGKHVAAGTDYSVNFEATGKHTVKLKVFDAAGMSSVTEMVVNVERPASPVVPATSSPGSSNVAKYVFYGLLAIILMIVLVLVYRRWFSLD